MMSEPYSEVTILAMEQALREVKGVCFLGADERLDKLLHEDNETVQMLGLSHAQLADPFFAAISAGKQSMDGEYQDRGKTFEFEVICAAGSIRSPFDSSVKVSRDMIVVNPRLEEYIRFSYLTPIFIRDHGFYQGHESLYRLNPIDIARIFELSGD